MLQYNFKSFLYCCKIRKLQADFLKLLYLDSLQYEELRYSTARDNIRTQTLFNLKLNFLISIFIFVFDTTCFKAGEFNFF